MKYALYLYLMLTVSFASDLLHREADLGNAEAQYQLGLHYKKLFEEDWVKARQLSDVLHEHSFFLHKSSAFFYFALAERQQHPQATFELALLSGCKEGYLLYQKAAERGIVEAHCKLGDLESNPKEAFFRYNEGAQLKHGLATLKLALCFHEGRGVQQNDRVAFDLFNKAFEREVNLAAYYLGVCYQNGFGVAPDKEKAIAYFKQIDNARSNHKLAILFEKEGRFEDALPYARKAIEQGRQEAATILGEYYLNHTTDVAQAAHFLWMGATGTTDAKLFHHYSTAQVRAGQALIQLFEEERLEKVPHKFYIHAAHWGHVPSLYQLGLNGLEKLEEPVNVFNYLKGAAQAGHQEALDLLEKVATADHDALKPFLEQNVPLYTTLCLRGAARGNLILLKQAMDWYRFGNADLGIEADAEQYYYYATLLRDYGLNIGGTQGFIAYITGQWHALMSG